MMRRPVIGYLRRRSMDDIHNDALAHLHRTKQGAHPKSAFFLSYDKRQPKRNVAPRRKK